MAILDANLVLSSAQAVTVTAASTGTLDLASLGVGNLVTNAFGTASVFGEDIGIGDGVSPPQIAVYSVAAFTAAGAATMQIQLEAAIDDGTGNPGTWDILVESDALGKALLTANTLIWQVTIPPRQVGQAFPRFYRLNYVVGTGPMTAGTITANVQTGVDNAPMYPAAY